MKTIGLASLHLITKYQSNFTIIQVTLKQQIHNQSNFILVRCLNALLTFRKFAKQQRSIEIHEQLDII